MRISWSGHRRRVALAFLIVGVPCVLLLILASRVVEQERELVRNRNNQARIRFAAELEQRMLHRLDRVRLAISAGDSAFPEPALVAVRSQDTLELPWQVSESYAPWPSSDRVRRAIARGEREELSEASPAAAVPHYRQAIEASSDPAESAYSQLLLARALARGGHEDDAIELYRKIAEGEPAVRDDQQIPIALYAIERLASLGERELEELIEPHLRPGVELPPTALHLLSDLAESIGSAELQGKIASRLRRISRGEQLRRDANAILSQRRPEGSDAGWIPYGDWLWLVGSVETAGTEMVIAIRAEDLVSSMTEEDPSLRGLELTHGWNEPGVVAIAAVPGIGLRLPALPSQMDEAASSRRVFFFASLGFVLLMSLTAATMLLRDVRREVQTAELRSQFVSSVSHELKTPLSAIRMYAESLQIGRPSASMKREEYLETIVNESERLSRLLDNVLLDRRGRDVELASVEPDDVDRLEHLQVDADLPGEFLPIGIDLEIEFVTHRLHVPRQLKRWRLRRLSRESLIARTSRELAAHDAIEKSMTRTSPARTIFIGISFDESGGSILRDRALLPTPGQRRCAFAQSFTAVSAASISPS